MKPAEAATWVGGALVASLAVTVLPASGLDWLTDETATHINTMRDEILIETQATIARRREAEAMLRRAGFTTEGSQR